MGLEAEQDSHIADDVVPNGKSRKTLKTSEGRIDLKTPRDRAGIFESQFIKKHQTNVTDEIETKILSKYGRGMSYSDIRGHVHEIYGISISTAAISAVTDELEATWGDKYPIVIQSWRKKWTMPIHNWNLTLSQLAIFFEGRLDDALDL